MISSSEAILKPSVLTNPSVMGSQCSLMTVDEVAKVLNVSRAQAYLLVREDGFPLIELGPRLLRVDPAQLRHWLDQKAA
jgi:excisionase family DNA binding protein